MKIFKLIIIGLFIISGVVCTAIKPDEYVPSDKDYEGDYKFEISVEDLASDTLEIFKEYSISFASTGVDSFKSFAVCDSTGNNITDTVNVDFSDNDSCIILYFKAPYKGALTFKAIRPNGLNESVKLKDSITIINPYLSLVDTIVGINSTNKAEVVKFYNSDTIPADLKIKWEYADTAITAFWPDTQNSQNFSFSVETFDIDFNVFLIDRYNQEYLLDSLKIRVEGNSPVIEDVKILSDSINVGDTLSVSVLVYDTDELDSFRLYVYAPLSGVMTSDTSKYLSSDSTYQIVKFVKPILDTGEIDLSIMAKGKLGGLSSNVKTKSIEVHYTLPMPLFGDTVKQVNIGDTSNISFVDNNYEEGTSYYWIIPELAFKCTTTTNNIDIPFLNEDTVNVFVKGINKFGHYGNTDSLKVIPQDFSYTVDIVESHDLLASNKYYTFKALVKNDIGDSITKNVKYYWSTVGAAVLIDFASSADSSFYTIKVNNESSSFKVKVIATIDDTIETPADEHPVTIDKKPIVTFKTEPMIVVLGNELICTLTVTDNGAIDSVYVLLNGSIINVTKDTTSNSDLYFCNLPGNNFGDDTVFAWAVDNEGNSSDTVSALYEKKSNKPAFIETFDSCTVYTYDTVTINLPEVYPGDDQSTISLYLWDLDGDSTFDLATEADSMPVMHDSAYNGIINVAAVNNLNDTSVVNFQYHLTVLQGEPVITKFEVNSQSSANAFIKEAILIDVRAVDSSTDGEITKFYIDVTGDAIADSVYIISDPITPYSTTYTFRFATGGKYILTGWAEDNHDNLSEKVILSDTIVIDQGAPIIDSLSSDSLIYINDTHSYTIHARDPKPAIKEYYWSKDSVTFDSLGDTKSFSAAFSNSGWNYVYLKVKDDDNNITVSKDSIYIELGSPFADSIVGDTLIFINDTNSYAFYFHDVNDSVDTVTINWGDGSTISKHFVSGQESIIVAHTFPITLDTVYEVALTVKDNDGVTNSCSQNIYVNSGKPSADLISGDSVIWVNDSVAYSFHYHDTNEVVDSLFINWGDGNSVYGYEAADSGNMLFKHLYPVTEDTNYTISFVVKDSDGLLDTATKSIAVYKGVPLLDSIKLSVELDTIFVNDTVTYRVFAHDVNDQVRAVYVSWNGDQVPEDSVIYLNEYADVSFKHFYDTSNSGSQTIRFWLDDSDEILSNDTSITINVREGRPNLWADTVDTIWVIVDNGTGENYPIHVNCYDTNGTFERFYWHGAATFDTTSGACFKTADSLLIKAFYQPEMHTGFLFHIYAKDNDGYMSGGQYIVYADSVPIDPTVVVSKIDDDIKIEWFGHDKKDKEHTEFKILYKKQDTATPKPDLDLETDILVDYSEGVVNYNYDEGTTGYSYTFTPTDGNGYYFFQVIARDKRGSVTIGTDKISVNY